MSVKQAIVISPDDMSETDWELVEILRSGRVTPQYLADEAAITRQYASEKLKRFREHDIVERLAPGLYELREDAVPSREDGDA